MFTETPANPTLKCTDIAAISELTRARGIPHAVDNTFLGPVFQHPLELGADLCVYSATKYLAGFSDMLGGVITGTAYAASKGGIEALTKSIAQELAPRNITVNCVAPGAVETPMLAAHPPERKAAMSASTPLKRMAQPEEIAAAVAYLLAEDAGFTTGAVLAVNGGLRMD